MVSTWANRLRLRIILGFDECETEMVVPVLRRAFDELRNNVSMAMVELLN